MIDALAAAIIIISITRANANSQIEIAKNTIHLIMAHAFSAIKDIFWLMEHVCMIHAISQRLYAQNSIKTVGVFHVAIGAF